MGFGKLALDPPLVLYAVLSCLLYLRSSQNTDAAVSAHLCKISNGLNTNMANFQDLEATQVESRNELKPLVLPTIRCTNLRCTNLTVNLDHLVAGN